MPEEMGPIEKVRTVVMSPTEFFSRIKSEEGVGKAFAYYAILSLISLAVGIIAFTFNMPFLSPLGSLFQFFPLLSQYTTLAGMIGLILPVGIYIIGLIGVFIGAAFVHLFIRLLGGKGDYSMTFKAVVYSATPSLLLGWIPYVGVIPGIYSFYLYLKGLSMLHLISMKRVLVAIFVIPIVIVLLLTVVLAGVAFFYISSLFTAQTASLLTLENSICNAGSYSIIIRNDGTQSMSTSSLRISIDGTPVTCSWSGNLSPGLSATCVASASASGGIHNIAVTESANTLSGTVYC